MFLIICWISSSPDPDNAMAKKWKQEKGMMGDAFKRNTSVLQSVGASGKYRNVWLLQDQSEFFSATLSDLIRTRRHGAACPVWETETEITATVKKVFFIYIYIYWFFSQFFLLVCSLSFSLECKHYQGAVGKRYVEDEGKKRGMQGMGLLVGRYMEWMK